MEKVIWFEKCHLVKEKKQPTKNSKQAFAMLHVDGIVGPTQKQCLGAGLAQEGVEGSSVLGLDVAESVVLLCEQGDGNDSFSQK